MQTHKNSNLRSGPAPFKAPPSVGAPAASPVKAPPSNKPPVFARDGKKWLVVSILCRIFEKKMFLIHAKLTGLLLSAESQTR